MCLISEFSKSTHKKGCNGSHSDLLIISKKIIRLLSNVNNNKDMYNTRVLLKVIITILLIITDCHVPVPKPAII